MEFRQRTAFSSDEISLETHEIDSCEKSTSATKQQIGDFILSPLKASSKLYFGPASGNFTECILQGIVFDEVDGEVIKEVDQILKICTDCEISNCSWVDQYWRKSKLGKSRHTKLNLVNLRESSESLLIRKYLTPKILEGKEVLRLYSPNHVVKDLQSSSVNVKKCLEVPVDSSIRSILRVLNFCKSHEIYIRGNIYHYKFKSLNHIIATIQIPYSDKELQNRIFKNCILVEIKGRCLSDNHFSYVESKLKEFAANLLPFVKLRKVES